MRWLYRDQVMKVGGLEGLKSDITLYSIQAPFKCTGLNWDHCEWVRLLSKDTYSLSTHVHLMLTTFSYFQRPSSLKNYHINLEILTAWHDGEHVCTSIHAGL